jgi:hypothetical protein
VHEPITEIATEGTNKLGLCNMINSKEFILKIHVDHTPNYNLPFHSGLSDGCCLVIDYFIHFCVFQV